MKTDYNLLHDPVHFRLVKDIRHDEIIWFIRAHLKPENPVGYFFYIFNLAIVLLFIADIFISFGSSSFSAITASIYFLSGIVVFIITLIPLHELIHLASFRLMGARKTRVYAQWDKFLFYAAADKFVMNFREFTWLALAPFILINVVLMVLLWNIDSSLRFGIWAALLFHSTGCIGDFILLGFLYKRENRALLNYDDLEKGTTYFYLPLQTPN